MTFTHEEPPKERYLPNMNLMPSIDTEGCGEGWESKKKRSTDMQNILPISPPKLCTSPWTVYSRISDYKMRIAIGSCFIFTHHHDSP